MKKSTTYSKYQQWCDADKPYWSGVGLANQVLGYGHLKRVLNAKESPWNKQKLDLFLREHMSAVPAEELKAADRAEAVATEQVAAQVAEQPRPLNPADQPRVVKLRGGKPVIIDNAISRLGPDVPAAWSTSKLVLPEFHELPDVLKKARLENNDRRREASMLHDQLAEGIEDDQLRRDMVAELVQRMDAVMASYDAERDWKLNGHVPNLPDDARATFEAMDLYKLKELITNSLAPRVSRWRKAVKVRDGDNLVEAKMRLAEAEADRALAQDILRRKQVEHNVAMEQRDKA